jgi:hypothetical protein
MAGGAVRFHSLALGAAVGVDYDPSNGTISGGT